MKKISLTLAVVLGITTLVFAAVQLPVQGLGIGYGPDRSSADQDADQQAQNNMQNLCVGMVVQSRKTGDQCTSNIGSEDDPKYMCTVSYSGMCQYGR
jgi:hypothetical protein